MARERCAWSERDGQRGGKGAGWVTQGGEHGLGGHDRHVVVITLLLRRRGWARVG